MSEVSLTITEEQDALLRQHLFPQDGCEAVAIGLCGRRDGKTRHRLLLRKLVLVPYDQCSERSPDRVTWPTRYLEPLLYEAAKNHDAIVKIHGHRGFKEFSFVDDDSDRELFPSIYSWMDDGLPHLSAIVVDDGSVIARVVDDTGAFTPLATVAIVGDGIRFSVADDKEAAPIPHHAKRIAQSFGSSTYEHLRRLRVAVIGCSGTGSVVIEQLARNCVGGLVLVDPDVVERKNLNRILNSTSQDAASMTPKVEVARRSIEAMGLGTVVQSFQRTLFDSEVVCAVGECDMVFGCVDTVDGRHLLNKLCTFYSLPYIDLGVRIDADGAGGVDQVCGSVHYLKPGGASLFSRNLYTMEQVRSAGLFRTDPKAYQSQLKDGYIRGVREDQPAVIQLNSLIASIAVNELLARLHPYRSDPNCDFAVSRVSLSHGIFDHESEGAACQMLSRHVGRGDVDPLLDWAELSTLSSEAA